MPFEVAMMGGKPIKMWLPVILLSLVACATPYQDYPGDHCTGFGGQCGGGEVTDLGNGIYRIHVEITNAKDDLALRYFERKRLELEEKHGSCETLFVVARDNKGADFLSQVNGAFADGRVKCSGRSSSLPSCYYDRAGVLFYEAEGTSCPLIYGGR